MITKERGEVLSIDYGVPFLETSARMDENIDQAFTTLAESILCGRHVNRNNVTK